MDYSKSEGEGREGLLSEDSYMICMEQYGIISIVNSGQQTCSFIAELEIFQDNLQREFGFDKRTVEIIVEMYVRVQEIYWDKSQKERDWYFTRALSQMGRYNHKEVDLKITQVETYAWVNGAGKVYKYNSRESDRRKFEERYFCEELGLDKEDYLYFRQMIRLQHFITSNEEDKYSYSTVVNMVNDDDKKNIHGWMDTMTEATEKNTMRNIMAIGYIITKNIWMTINRYMTGPLIKEIFHI